MGKKASGFHTPFDKLKAVKLPVPAKPVPVVKVAPKPTPRAEAALFEDEMAGVRPLEADPGGRAHAPPPSERPSRSRRQADDDEAYAVLADLVDGVGPFDITATDEYIEGLAPGIDRRLLRKLKRGDFALQGHLDLHGLLAEDARGEVERFLDRARTDGKRCLLIVHGRGLNSKDGIPVLKERLKTWLTVGRLSKSVLCFCTARPTDGGAGAVYLLLRKA